MTGTLLILTIAVSLWIASCINPRMQPSADWEAVRRWAGEEARDRLAVFAAEHEARLSLYGDGHFTAVYRAEIDARRREAARRRWAGLFKDTDLVAAVVEAEARWMSPAVKGLLIAKREGGDVVN